MHSPIRRLVLTATALSCLAFAPTTVLADDSMDAWATKVAQDFASRQRYPRAAIENKEEGVVKVEVSVVADGHITGFSITEGSGHATLDNEVLALLNRVNPLPALPSGHDSYNFSIPLRYKLAAGTEMAADVEMASGEDMWKTWQKAVGRTLARKQAYPTALLGSGVEGTVKVELVIAADGTIVGQNLAQSSGNEALDMEAMNLMREISLPALPEPDHPITIVVPLTYRVKQ